MSEIDARIPSIDGLPEAAFRGCRVSAGGNGDGSWSVLPTFELERIRSELSRLRSRTGDGEEDPAPEPEFVATGPLRPGSSADGGDTPPPGGGDGSYRDPVTGLVRRAVLEDRIRKSFARRKRSGDHVFALASVDLDGFHEINEVHGRRAGDEVLAQVGRRIRGCLREVDTVARIAADGFGVHIDDLTNEGDPVRVARRVQRSLAAPVEVGDRRIRVSACVGIALASSDAKDTDQLFWAAQKALTRAKARGRDQIQVFDPAVHARATLRRSVEARIRRGLENDELSLRYQPIVELSTGRIESVEALLRWERPDGEAILPQNIIPVAEETGLIVPLGWWSLETACRQAVLWRSPAPGSPAPRVSVNVSARQLAQPGFHTDVARILERAGLPGDALQLEITETAVMRDADAAAETLERVRELGAQIHLDDFGTGYSCLSHLCHLPIDAVKIDRAFIRTLAESRQSLQVVRTIIDLARELGLGVVAEGVETVRQEVRLRQLGCSSAQGYRYHRPLTGDAVGALLG